MIEAVEHNAVRAAGNYARPPLALPKWPQGKLAVTANPTKGNGLKLSTLVERYLSAKHPRIKANTLECYKPALLEFVRFLRNPIASAVPEEDVRAFKAHRLADGQRTEATYYRADLPAIKSLFMGDGQGAQREAVSDRKPGAGGAGVDRRGVGACKHFPRSLL